MPNLEIELADNHCHLHSPEYTGYEGTVFVRAQRAGLTRICLMNVDWPSFQDNSKICKYWGKIYPGLKLQLAFGLDMELVIPHSDIFELEYFKSSRQGLLEKVARLYDLADKLAAKENQQIQIIGEIGLDHYWLNKFFAAGEITKQDLLHSGELQEELFVWQLNYAREHGLDVSIHSRAAEKDCLGIVSKYYPASAGELTFHSYTGSAGLMNRILDQGYKIGLNGIITYNSAETLREAVVRRIVQQLELGKTKLSEIGFLLETDAPFLIPSNADRPSLVTAYGQAINEPASVKFLKRYLQEQLAKHYT